MAQGHLQEVHGCLHVKDTRTLGKEPLQSGTWTQSPRVSRAQCGSQWTALVERKMSHPAEAERGRCLGAWESPSMCSWPPNAPVSEQSHTLGIGTEFRMIYYQCRRERERERVQILLSVPMVVGGGWIKPPMVSAQSTIHLSSVRTNPLHIKKVPQWPSFIHKTSSFQLN